MPIQFKLNPDTGELCDVEIVRAPRDARTYNKNYYEAKTKKYCNANTAKPCSVASKT